MRTGAVRALTTHDALAVFDLDTTVRHHAFGIGTTASELLLTQRAVIIIVAAHLEQVEDGADKVRLDLKGTEVIALEVDIEIALDAFAHTLVVNVYRALALDGQGEQAFGEVSILRDDLELRLESDGLIHAVLHAQDTDDLIDDRAEAHRPVAKQLVPAGQSAAGGVKVGVDGDRGGQVEHLFAPVGVVGKVKAGRGADRAGGVIVRIGGLPGLLVQALFRRRDREDEVFDRQRHIKGLLFVVVEVRVALVIEEDLLIHSRADGVYREFGGFLFARELTHEHDLAKIRHSDVVQSDGCID